MSVFQFYRGISEVVLTAGLKWRIDFRRDDRSQVTFVSVFPWTRLQVSLPLCCGALDENSRFCTECIECIRGYDTYNECQWCAGRLLIKTGNTSSSAHAGDGRALMDEFYSNPAHLWAVINCVSRMARSQIRFSPRPALSFTAIEIRIQFVGVWPLAQWFHSIPFFFSYSRTVKKINVENSVWNNNVGGSEAWGRLRNASQSIKTPSVALRNKNSPCHAVTGN